MFALRPNPNAYPWQTSFLPCHSLPTSVIQLHVDLRPFQPTPKPCLFSAMLRKFGLSLAISSTFHL
jgi:hypothetical protein